MKRFAATVVLAVLCLPACGGSSGPTAPPAPVGPTQANITVTQNGTAQLCFSPVAGFALRLRVPVTLRESAGLGANINFIRMSFLNASGGELERQEIGSTAIIAGLGSNRLSASETRNLTYTINFNVSGFSSARTEFNFGDDRGNTLTATITSISPIVSVVTCTI